jgi:dTDP-4-dehydrorhamnose 3,5-epimerase-like enzyme
MFDVAVDIRWGSPGFDDHVPVVLSAAERNQIFIPEGFFTATAPSSRIRKSSKFNRYYPPSTSAEFCGVIGHSVLGGR